MTLRASEEPTRTQTASATKTPLKVKHAPPSRHPRAKPKADPSTTWTTARARRGPKAVSPRPGSKAAKVVALLKRPQGAGLKELLRATGWQPHSIRGFLNGTVVRKLGLKISSTKAESGERRYAVKA